MAGRVALRETDGDADSEEQKRLRFHLKQFVDAMAPVNYLLTNPAALKRAIDWHYTEWQFKAALIVSYGVRRRSCAPCSPSCRWSPHVDHWTSAHPRLASRRHLSKIYNPMLPSLVSANLLIVACAPVRLLGLLAGRRSVALMMSQVEDVLLIFASPLLWSSLFFFIA